MMACCLQLTLVAALMLASGLAQAAAPPKVSNNGLTQATSPVASARLMKELVELYKSDIYKSGMIQMELVEDNLYEWQVKLFIVDPENPLHEDLQRWKAERGGDDYILLRVSFGADYPAGPPFVRVVGPVLESKYSFRGGSVCMHLLSKQGWIPECSFESLILSLVDIMTEGKTRVRFEKYTAERGEIYTENEAREQYEEAMKFHRWDRAGGR